jgi:hypothetical protein
MARNQIPFEIIGIPPEIGSHVSIVINRLLSEYPDDSVDVQRVSEETGYLRTVVKEVFYALLAFRMLKATFLPRHRVCGNIVGLQEKSVEVIRHKARRGDYVCSHCFTSIDFEDIEIQIVFWKPGANVNG